EGRGARAGRDGPRVHLHLLEERTVDDAVHALEVGPAGVGGVDGHEGVAQRDVAAGGVRDHVVDEHDVVAGRDDRHAVGGDELAGLGGLGDADLVHLDLEAVARDGGDLLADVRGGLGPLGAVAGGRGGLLLDGVGGRVRQGGGGWRGRARRGGEAAGEQGHGGEAAQGGGEDTGGGGHVVRSFLWWNPRR